jgi:peptidoglycan biosynthesis protein MviN/MurJ (putative lipid II flippase)
MQQGGLALATVMSSILNNCLLLYFLKKSIRYDLGLDQVGYSLLRSAVASVIPAVVLFYFYKSMGSIYTIKYLPLDAMPLLICGVAFCISYALISWLCRSRELPELVSMFRRG